MWLKQGHTVKVSLKHNTALIKHSLPEIEDNMAHITQ